MHRHDGVDLYHDPPLFRPLRHLEHCVDVRSGSTIFCASLLEVCLRVERITGYGHHVEILAVRIQPLLGHSRAVVHDGARLEVKFVFAVLEHLPNVTWLEERLSAADVEFLHLSIGEETKGVFRFVEREDKIVRGGMKAKIAFVIAHAMGKPVDGDWDEPGLWSGFRDEWD